MSPPLVLVAGASGALGSHVVRSLAARGISVRALARDPARVAHLGADVNSVHRGDALDADSLAGAFDGVSATFSCVGASVALAPFAGYRGYSSVDTPANRNLVAAARAQGVHRFVYVSAHHTPDEIALDYFGAHERVVDTLRAGAMAWAVVRPTGFFSAFSQLVSMARAMPLPIFGDGTARTNPIHERDLADVCADAILDSNPALEIDVGGPETFTRAEIAALACRAVGRAPRFVHVPPALARLGALFMRPFSPRLSHLVGFVVSVATRDAVAPSRGARTLEAYLRERAGTK